MTVSRADIAAGKGLSPSTTTIDMPSDSIDLIPCGPARCCGICTISCCALLNFALAVAALSIGIVAFTREDPMQCVDVHSTLTKHVTDMDGGMHVTEIYTFNSQASNKNYWLFENEDQSLQISKQPGPNPEMYMPSNNPALGKVFYFAPSVSSLSTGFTTTYKFSGSKVGGHVCYMTDPSGTLHYMSTMGDDVDENASII